MGDLMEYTPGEALDAAASYVHGAFLGSQTVLYIAPPADRPRACIPLVSDCISRLVPHVTLDCVHMVAVFANESEYLTHPVIRYLTESYDLGVWAVTIKSGKNTFSGRVITSIPEVVKGLQWVQKKTETDGKSMTRLNFIQLICRTLQAQCARFTWPFLKPF